MDIKLKIKTVTYLCYSFIVSESWDKILFILSVGFMQRMLLHSCISTRVTKSKTRWSCCQVWACTIVWQSIFWNVFLPTDWARASIMGMIFCLSSSFNILLCLLTFWTEDSDPSTAFFCEFMKIWIQIFINLNS